MDPFLLECRNVSSEQAARALDGRRVLVIDDQPSIRGILQVALESDALSEQQLFDFGINFVRADMATIQGVQMPYPYGGKQRLIMIDIDPQRLFAWGLSPRDVTNAVSQQNIIVPTGTVKIGASEYPIVLNASPDLLAQIETLPVKVVRNTTVYVRDVAHVRDGYSPQTNIVHVEGRRSVLMSILKQSGSSTLEIVRRTGTGFTVQAKRWIVERTIAWKGEWNISATLWARRRGSTMALRRMMPAISMS